MNMTSSFNLAEGRIFSIIPDNNRTRYFKIIISCVHDTKLGLLYQKPLIIKLNC